MEEFTSRVVPKLNYILHVVEDPLCLDDEDSYVLIDELVAGLDAAVANLSYFARFPSYCDPTDVIVITGDGIYTKELTVTNAERNNVADGTLKTVCFYIDPTQDYECNNPIINVVYVPIDYDDESDEYLRIMDRNNNYNYTDCTHPIAADCRYSKSCISDMNTIDNVWTSGNVYAYSAFNSKGVDQGCNVVDNLVDYYMFVYFSVSCPGGYGVTTPSPTSTTEFVDSSITITVSFYVEALSVCLILVW
eukprot:UN11454